MDQSKGVILYIACIYTGSPYVSFILTSVYMRTKKSETVIDCHYYSFAYCWLYNLFIIIIIIMLFYNHYTLESTCIHNLDFHRFSLLCVYHDANNSMLSTTLMLES